jgi:NAD(P) transhydrogenase
MGTRSYEYDMLVIGSGPGGQRAAIQAAKLHKRVAVVERRDVVGGVSIHTGTIPSKTLREAVLYLTGYREHSFYGESYAVKPAITMDDLRLRSARVVEHEIDVATHQLLRNGVEVIGANARFAGPHTLHLAATDGELRTVSAEYIVIATGTSPARPTGATIDGRRVFDSDGILSMESLPRTLMVVGAGVIGCEYAAMFATLGVKVTLLDARPRLLPFADTEIVETLEYHLRARGVTLRLGETVDRLETAEDGRVWVQTASNKRIAAEAALLSAGRVGATATLNLEAVGLGADARGRLAVDEHYRTSAPDIYAVGDVIGFPSLASTSMEQGRLAACHAFGVPAVSTPERFPHALFTIPEIAMVGSTEEELTAAGVPYEVGKAHYREIARGQIIGDTTGMLKLLFHAETRAILGVHIIGEGAADLVHLGQAAIALGGTVDYFIDTVFNYPTLGEAYKTAALDGANRLQG